MHPRVQGTCQPLESPTTSMIQRHDLLTVLQAHREGYSEPAPPPPQMLQPSPETHGKLYPTQEATRIAAWSSTMAPLKQCPDKYRPDEWFSELRVFGSGHFVRRERPATSEELSIVFFFFLLIEILCARRAEGLQARSRGRITIKARALPHLHVRPADSSLQTNSESVPKMLWGQAGLCCGFKKQQCPLYVLSLGLMQNRCQEDPGTSIT